MEKNKDFLQILRNVDEKINGKSTDEEWNETTEANWDDESTSQLLSLFNEQDKIEKK